MHFGSFLQWVDVFGIRFVGRLIRLVGNGNADGPPQALQMNVYNLKRTASPLPPHSLRCLQEIEQTEILSVVAIQSICEIAFVLSVDEFQMHVITVSTKFTNVFLVRSNSINNPIVGHCAFPSEVLAEQQQQQQQQQGQIFAEHCLAKTIMIDVRNIRSTIHKSMNRVSQTQSDAYQDMKPVSISTSTWNYLIRNLHQQPSLFNSRTTIARLGMYASRFKETHTRICSLIRSETKEELRILNELVGGGILLGIRLKPPPIGEQSIAIHDGDIINVLYGEDELQPGPVTRRCGKERSGIDLCWFGEHFINIYVRYERSVYDSNNLEFARLIAAPQKPHPPNTDDDDEEQESLIDRVFYYNNHAYTVIQVLNIDGKTLVIGTDRNENEIEIGIEKIKFIDYD